MRSLHYPSNESREAARELVRLEELDRQARTASWCFGRAFESAVTEPKDDFRPWAYLQGGMFAAIVVQRLLLPRGVRKYPHLASKQESQAQADARGERLRGLLHVEDDSPLLAVSKVRDAFEHFDEHLDRATRPEVICLSDWYITQDSLVASSIYDDMVTLGLRTYCPLLGVVFHEDELLDVFALDDALLELREEIKQATGQTASAVKGRGLLGGQMKQLNKDKMKERCEPWLNMRQSRGDTLSVSVTWTDA